MGFDTRTDRPTAIAALDHVNIRSHDLDACRCFYVQALGFEEGFRPPFALPGLWLYAAGLPLVHVVATASDTEAGSGNIDHIAFRAHDYETFTARLRDHGIAFEDRAVPAMALHQVFCLDPHGIKLEFNFEGRDRPVATLRRERDEAG